MPRGAVRSYAILLACTGLVVSTSLGASTGARAHGSKRICVVQYDDRSQKNEATQAPAGTLSPFDDSIKESQAVLMHWNQGLCERAANCSYQRHGAIPMAAYWAKVAVVQETLIDLKCGYALWLDADAVMHRQIPNASALLGTQHMLISKDLPEYDDGKGAFNAGSFLVKNGAVGHKILEMWLSHFNRTHWSLVTAACDPNLYRRPATDPPLPSTSSCYTPIFPRTERDEQ